MGAGEASSIRSCYMSFLIFTLTFCHLQSNCVELVVVGRVSIPSLLALEASAVLRVPAQLLTHRCCAVRRQR